MIVPISMSISVSMSCLRLLSSPSVTRT
jgi:hypothetical protein